METPRKRVRMVEEANQSIGKDLQTLLEQFEEQENADGAAEQTRSVADHQQNISETLHTLEEGITSIRSCLEKPKPKRVNLNEINRKIDLILKILYSWNTAASP